MTNIFWGGGREEKDDLMKKTNLTLKQLNNWFTNSRKRIWKPFISKLQSMSGIAVHTNVSPNLLPSLSNNVQQFLPATQSTIGAHIQIPAPQLQTSSPMLNLVPNQSLIASLQQLHGQGSVMTSSGFVSINESGEPSNSDLRKRQNEGPTQFEQSWIMESLHMKENPIRHDEESK